MILQRKILKRMIEIKGRTLVNLLGRDGNCEDVSKWNTWQATLSLDSVNAKYGGNCIKITMNGANCVARQSARLFQGGKYYIYLADIKIGDATNVCVSVTPINISSPYSTSTLYTTAYTKIYSVTDIIDDINISVSGSVGKTAYFDGARIYEITDSLAQSFGYSTGLLLYNAIGTTITDAEVIGRMFPYVDSVQYKSNIMGVVKGKQLIPPYSQWDLIHPNAVINADYSLTLNATGVNQQSYIVLTLVPNTSYKISFGSGNVYHGVFSNSGSRYGWSTASTLTFTTHASDTLYTFYFSSNGAGTFTFTNPMLTLATADQTFEPQVKSTFHSPLLLATGEKITIMTGGQSKYLQLYTKTKTDTINWDIPVLLSSPITHYNYVNNDIGQPILSAGSTVIIPAGIGQLEQKTGINWPAKTDMANKYSVTVDIGTAVDNTSGVPASFMEQNYLTKRKTVMG
jgi:hypothetical protein